MWCYVTRRRRAAAGEASAATRIRAVREVSPRACWSVGDWACPRRLNRACSSAAVASPAAAGQSGV